MITDAFTWPKFNIIKSISHGKNYMEIPSEKPIVLYCPDSNFKSPDALKSKDNTEAICIYGSLFSVRGQKIDFSDLICDNQIKPVVKWIKKNCAPSLYNTELYTVGYTFGTQYLKVYEVCIDKNYNIPFYTTINVDKYVSKYIPGSGPQYTNINKLPIDFEELYSRPMGSRRNSCHISKRQLVSPSDVRPGLHGVTYDYFNVIPQWSCNQQVRYCLN